MIKTLRISFSLRNTYKVNSILYAVKQFPLLKKIIPANVYQKQSFKIFANILSILWEMISIFIWKLSYIGLMIFGYITLSHQEESVITPVFLHVLIFLTLIGALVNTYMFNPSKDKYYAMILMSMNAKQYTLVNYSYDILKILIGFTISSVLFGSLLNIPLWICIIIPFFVAGIKLSVAAKTLYNYEKKLSIYNENKQTAPWMILILILLLAAYVLPVLHFTLPQTVSLVFMGICILSGLFSLKKILTFPYYREMYKELLIDTVIDTSKAAIQVQAEQGRKRISTDVSITSDQKGFEYLNELFMKRHQRILSNTTKKITFGAFCFFVLSSIVLLVKTDAQAEVNHILLTYLPYMVFIMYFLNRGTTFTQALFMNCDHSLLTYSYFRKPQHVLKLFRIRLREIVKINLQPALIIGFGLCFLLYITGGTDQITNYILLFTTIIALNIFFSLHYLTLYYLLQPYNAGTEVKSLTNQIAVWLTYIICYAMLKLHISTFVFGMGTILFCVVYCIIANLLVYRLAPKTFRIHK